MKISGEFAPLSFHKLYVHYYACEKDKIWKKINGSVEYYTWPTWENNIQGKKVYYLILGTYQHRPKKAIFWTAWQDLFWNSFIGLIWEWYIFDKS